MNDIVYYRSVRLIEGKPKWVIADKDGNIVDKNPTKERLKITIIDNIRKGLIPKDRRCHICEGKETYIGTDGRHYWHCKEIGRNKIYICQNCYDLTKIYGITDKDKIKKIKQEYRKKKIGGRSCCICGNVETFQNIRGGYDWFNHYKCDDEDCTGFLCRNCYVRYDPNGSSHTKKSSTSTRRGYLDITSSTAEGIIGELIVGYVRNIVNHNIVSDNFNSPIDLIDPELGRINVKLATLNHIRGKWTFGPRKNTYIDTYIFLGMDEFINKWKNVYEVWIVPNKGDIVNICNTSIYRYPSRPSKYDICKTNIEHYNDAYQKLRIYLKDRKWIGIDDVKKWLYQRNL